MNIVEKRRLITIILVLSLTAFYGCKEKSNFAVAHNGIVNFVQGECFIVTGSDEKTAVPGDSILQGMKIVTRSDKSIIDIYIDENAIRITGNSELEFSKLFKSTDGSSEQVQMTLTKGSVFSKVLKKLTKQDEYVIKTPTAVASVRGTEFMVEQSDSSSNVSCLDGLVAVKDLQTDKEIVIAENEQVQAERGKDMVKSQIQADKLKAFEIIRNIKEIQADIFKKYEEQKKEIMEKVDQQIEQDKKLVDDQKAKDAENIENINKDIDAKKDEINESVEKGIEDSTKTVDEKMKEVQPDLDKAAPEIDPKSF